MSEIMKTVSNFGQNFRAFAEAFAVLEKPGRFPSRRVGEDSPGTWLPADTKRGRQALTLGRWDWSYGEAVSSVKLLIFFVGQPWPVIPCSLRGRQPASQTRARWVSRLCVDRLPVVD